MAASEKMNCKICWTFIVITVSAKMLIMKAILDKVFKNGPSKIWGRQPIKNLKGYGLL